MKHPLSNLDIENILMMKLRKEFRGCYARDNLPTKLRTGCYVLNLDAASNEGTHWTCFIVSRKEIEYFDPFGFQPPIDLIERKLSRTLIYSTHLIQNMSAVSCGLWVCYYLHERFLGNADRVELLMRFSNDGSNKNESKLRKWASEYLT